MEIRETVFYLAGYIGIAGYLPYIWRTWRRKVVPAKATWIVWGVVDWVIVAGLIAQQKLMPAMLGLTIGATVIALLALGRGKPGWSAIDTFCLGAAFVGILAWKMTDQPNVAVALCLIVMVIGSIPTFARVWENPKGEDRISWSIRAFASFLGVVAAPAGTFADVATPATICAIQAAVLVFIFFRQKVSAFQKTP